jgi:two-component system sensor kinase FixL
LIRNGLDAMEDSPKRELVIAAAPMDTELLRVSVSDTGAGVGEDYADQLFQPFVTSKRSGMGVGLSISRTIIETHGGRIWFEPNSGGGTVFHFTLQRARLEEEAHSGD